PRERDLPRLLIAQLLEVAVAQLGLARSHLHGLDGDTDVRGEGGDFERIAGPEDEIGGLTGGDSAAGCDAKDVCGRGGDRFKRYAARQAVSGRVACGLSDSFRAGAGVLVQHEGNANTCAIEERGVVEASADLVEVS